MRGSVFMLLILACQLVWAGDVYACGIKHGSSAPKEMKHISKKGECCDRQNQRVPGNKKKICGHHCDGPGCSCTHSIPVLALKVLPTCLLLKPVFEIFPNNPWFFKETTPTPVYLSLWMPPNISC